MAATGDKFVELGKIHSDHNTGLALGIINRV